MQMDKDGLVLVTGGGGFIGGHIIHSLLAQGFTSVRGVDVKPLNEWYQLHGAAENHQLDCRDLDQCRRAVRGARYIFNMAADMGGMGFMDSQKTACMLSVVINSHMLAAASETGEVARFFYPSSACIYPTSRQYESADRPFTESDAYPADAEDGYGWEKLFSERMCRHFREDCGIETRVARYQNVYGPLGAWRCGREKAPAALCRKVAEAKITGHHEIEIWGDGEQTRSFMYVDDCVTGTQLIACGDEASPINLGRDETITINQLVSIVEAAAGITLKRNYKLDAPQGVRGRSSDHTLLTSLTGWTPDITLASGMERTFRWIYDEALRTGHMPAAAR